MASAVPFVVEYVVVVDHPELRDPSFRPVPRGLRISHRESFTTFGAASRLYDRILSGEHDYGSEYIGRVVVKRKRPGRGSGFSIARKEVARERRAGKVVQLGAAEGERRKLEGEAALAVGRVVTPQLARVIKAEATREQEGAPRLFGPKPVAWSDPKARLELLRSGTTLLSDLAAMLHGYERDYLLAGSPGAYWQQKRDRYGVDPQGDAGKPPEALVKAGLVDRVKFVGGLDPKMAFRGGLLTDRGRELARFLRAQAGAAPAATSESLAAPPVRTPEPPPVAIVAAPPGQLFAPEHEGFALTAPRGEFGGGSMRSQGTQVELISRKVDAAKMSEIAERERAERAARARRSEPAGPSLLPPPEPALPPPPDPDALPWELQESAPAPASILVEKEEAPAELGEARLEFVDVATGEPRSPEAPGTASSGQLVADLEGTAVVVDPEDVIGRPAEPDPRRRRYRFDLESPADYKAQARRRKQVATRKPKPLRRPRVPGVQSTFRTPAAAARIFYDANAAFFDNIPDPIDGLREWADGVDVRVSKTKSKRLAKTSHGQRIFAASRGQGQIEAALRYLFGQAKGKRWAAVPWADVDRLEAALVPLYADAPGGTGGITWRPTVGELDVATLDAMPPDVRQRVRDYESHVELKDALEKLRETYRRTRACIPAPMRRTVLHRIKAWSTWERAPQKIPAYACEPDLATGGHLCNYPAVAGELRELRRACEVAYDPDWALPDARKGEPGFPDLSAGEPDIAPRPLPVMLTPPPLPVAPAAATKPPKSETQPAKMRAKQKPARPERPTSKSEPKKPSAKKTPTRTEIEECASLLGQRGAEARKRKRRERLSAEERAALLEDALDLATL